MSKKSFNESREKNYVNHDGLKERRLKNESRWKYNPAETYDEEDHDEYDYQEERSQFG